MHIEPGFIAPAKVVVANIACTGLLAGYAHRLLAAPGILLRTGLAAVFFSLFMQAFHMPVGPSELHFVGAMAIYLTLGFLPTLYGFAIGLALQGLIFDPHDLPHLAVNSLSLIVPLLAVHYATGRRLFAGVTAARRLTWARIVQLDAMYYGGVTLMVGFWLALGETATPLSAWARFAASYLAVVACEPLVTWATVRLLKRYQDRPVVARCTTVRALEVHG